jgi:hypothetical protein
MNYTGSRAKCLAGGGPRSSEGLGRTLGGQLLGHTLEVNLPRLSLALTLGTAATVAKLGPRLDVALGDLVPPLLLRGAPNFLLRTVGALKRRVDVVPACDERRNPIAVVWREQRGIARRHRSIGELQRPRIAASRGNALLGNRAPMGQDFSAALLVALHGFCAT